MSQWVLRLNQTRCCTQAVQLETLGRLASGWPGPAAALQAAVVQAGMPVKACSSIKSGYLNCRTEMQLETCCCPACGSRGSNSDLPVNGPYSAREGLTQPMPRQPQWVSTDSDSWIWCNQPRCALCNPAAAPHLALWYWEVSVETELSLPLVVTHCHCMKSGYLNCRTGLQLVLWVPGLKQHKICFEKLDETLASVHIAVTMLNWNFYIGICILLTSKIKNHSDK